MLKLKDVLIDLNAAQDELAQAVDLNRVAIAHLVDYNLWPGSLDRKFLKGRIVRFLAQRGANVHVIGSAFEEVDVRIHKG
ncbi:hypothetical protein [Pseudomonas sp. URMO17WK12:I11]|uniref:hypothetical protein n=1 Tax=Pseudomonas sp. URMO17WK12:I11 TaxID=1283291 RepID=UPI00072182E6|nr:hypothetical protein [Pseudomonas sp. URMO17WK12:I11]CRL51638.1 hypothetical protein PSHI_48310 [Pseudomonas sp. URMO17WK12:I11]